MLLLCEKKTGRQKINFYYIIPWWFLNIYRYKKTIQLLMCPDDIDIQN